jgi:hypothetical protein
MSGGISSGSCIGSCPRCGKSNSTRLKDVGSVYATYGASLQYAITWSRLSCKALADGFYGCPEGLVPCQPNRTLSYEGCNTVSGRILALGVGR